MVNFALHVGFMVAVDFVSVFLFKNRSEFKANAIYLYTATAILQLALNFLIYRKLIRTNWIIMPVIIVFILILYLIIPIGIV